MWTDVCLNTLHSEIEWISSRCEFVCNKIKAFFPPVNKNYSRISTGLCESAWSSWIADEPVLCFFLLIWLFSFLHSRRKAVQMSSMWQGVQSVLQPHHPQPEAHRIQAFCLWDLLEGLPAQGRSPSSYGDAARSGTSWPTTPRIRPSYVTESPIFSAIPTNDTTSGWFAITLCQSNPARAHALTLAQPSTSTQP